MGDKRRITRLFALVLVVLMTCGLTGCARFQAPNRKLSLKTYNAEGAMSESGQYLIGVRDELEVIVWRCPELNATVDVRSEDGRITLPLIGDVEAKGLSPQQLADSISDKMAFYVKDPRIAVRVTGFGDKKVALLGQVMRAGTFRLPKGGRILDLLSDSGGFNDNAMKCGAYIVRGDYYDSRIIRVNLARLVHQGDKTQNVLLEDGDMVYIPEQEIENLNYALRKIFPSMYFAERLNDLKNNIMTGGYDWHQVFAYMSGNWRKPN